MNKKEFPEGAGPRLSTLNSSIIDCRKCPRLVDWRESVAREKVRRFSDQTYWGNAVPGFGDRDARLLIVGLAPAAHGANRTGRMFTGDRSGEWLYGTLHKFGFANQADSTAADDGLSLTDCYITAVARCAPPQNKLTAEEIANCRPFLVEEISLLKNIRVIVALGKLAFDETIKLLKGNKVVGIKERPKFAHGATFHINERLSLIASYHPSQQNTFTGKLTRPMFESVFRKARGLTGS